MPSAILDKYAANQALAITLASLASSTTGVGRQSTLVDNSVTRHRKILLFAKVKLGIGPVSYRAVRLWLVRGNGTIRTDGAGPADAAITRKAARFIGSLPTGNSPANGDVLQGVFEIDAPGPEWGIVVEHDTGVALDATAANHAIEWQGVNPEAQ